VARTMTMARFNGSPWPLTLPVASAPPPMMANSDPTGRPIDEMKLSTKTAAYPAETRKWVTVYLFPPLVRRHLGRPGRATQPNFMRLKVEIPTPQGGNPCDKGRKSSRAGALVSGDKLPIRRLDGTAGLPVVGGFPRAGSALCNAGRECCRNRAPVYGIFSPNRRQIIFQSASSHYDGGMGKCPRLRRGHMIPGQRVAIFVGDAATSAPT
jgi:hypothetical protein